VLRNPPFDVDVHLYESFNTTMLKEVIYGSSCDCI
jgi:hypothetical protein